MMSPADYLGLLVFLPLLATPLALVLGRVIGRRASELVALSASFVVLIASILLYRSGLEGVYNVASIYTPFIPAKAVFSIVVDDLSKIFSIIIGLIGFLVILYSVSYMERDPGYARYYAFMLLFIASMQGLVLTNNIAALYAFWEGVGLCSFTLIGHYYERPRAGIAGVKAFVTTRLGDVVFLAGIAYTYIHTHTLSLIALKETSPHVASVFFASALIGAIAKSAQLPLHVWLPDAMEGPTPVSALIHAATMVKAGVYLIARLALLLSPLIASTYLPSIVMWVGAITALYAALSALAQYDAKRLLAYSTISQLGYIFTALGAALAIIGSVDTALGHVISHAVFKALLFLCVGVVIHELEPLLGPETARDLRRTMGVARKSPILALSLFCGTMALAGIPPFNGFWTKDELIIFVSKVSLSASIVLLVTSLITAAYSFKLFYYLVLARPRKEGIEAITRVPVPMATALLVLSFLTLASPILIGPGLHLSTNIAFIGIALALAITGIVLVVEAYRRRLLVPRYIYSTLLEGFYIDRFYVDYLVPSLRFVFTLLGIGMLRVVDVGLDNSIKIIVSELEAIVPRRSGRMSAYYALYALGMVLLVIAAFALLR